MNAIDDLKIAIKIDRLSRTENFFTQWNLALPSVRSQSSANFVQPNETNQKEKKKIHIVWASVQ